MPAWLSLHAPSAIARVGGALVWSVLAGCVVSLAMAWWSLQIEQGAAPTSGGLHVREGRFWWVATDRAFGLDWVNIERMGQPSSNPRLELPGIPSWAEPMSKASTLGEWRVGTLAVGWPSRMVVRQWSETDPDRLFVPHAEVDDDGFSIAKMAANFVRSRAPSRLAVLPAGALANIALFGALMFLVLLPRIARSPALPEGVDRSSGA